MRKIHLAAASLGALLLASSPASATITFNLDNVKLIDGSFLTGSLTTSEDFVDLIDFSFTTTAMSSEWGNFTGATYRMDDAIGSVFWIPGLTIQANFGDPVARIDLFFAAPLTAEGGKVAGSSNEWVSAVGHRYVVSGSVSPQVAAVPEPATWAMLIGGLGLVGATMRRRAAKVQFA